MNGRFDRHHLIPGWQQPLLEAASVVVMGVGALGNEVSRLLAMAGVKRIILCDPDKVERSNLSRTALFSEADLGTHKVEAARAALLRLAPAAIIEARPLPLINGVGLAELRDASLVLGCLDSRAARLQLAGRCNLVRARHLDGATDPWGGEVRLFTGPDGPCYGCGLTPAERAVDDVPWSCLDLSANFPQGAAAPSSALVGGWMALLATRLLMGLPCPEGAVTIHAAQGTSRAVKLARDPECPLHHPLDRVRRINLSHQNTVGDLRSELGPGRDALLWSPAQMRVTCPHCGFSEARWGMPAVIPCPRCGKDLRPGTTLEIAEAPIDCRLESLGVAPGEILPVRVREQMEFVELSC